MQYAIVEYIIKNRWYIINGAKKKERKKERHVTTRRLLNFINTEYMPGLYLSIH